MPQSRPIKSTQQKDKSRGLIVASIAQLDTTLCDSGNWQLHPASFVASEEDDTVLLPLDVVQFNPHTYRYEVVRPVAAAAVNDEDEAHINKNSKNNNKKKRKINSSNNNHRHQITDDDVIVQAMVVYLLYRLEHGMGNKESFQKLLSIWGANGEIKKKSTMTTTTNEEKQKHEVFPLDNLWHDEIRDWIVPSSSSTSSKSTATTTTTKKARRLGATTLGHCDNYYSIPDLYGCKKGRWGRRQQPPNYLTRVHILAEQAMIQSALYLHHHVSRQYAILASTILQYALLEYNPTTNTNHHKTESKADQDTERHHHNNNNNTNNNNNNNDNDNDNANANANANANGRIMSYLAKSLHYSARKENRNGPFPLVAYDDIIKARQEDEQQQQQQQQQQQNILHQLTTNSNNNTSHGTSTKRHRTEVLAPSPVHDIDLVDLSTEVDSVIDLATDADADAEAETDGTINVDADDGTLDDTDVDDDDDDDEEGEGEKDNDTDDGIIVPFVKSELLSSDEQKEYNHLQQIYLVGKILEESAATELAMGMQLRRRVRRAKIEKYPELKNKLQQLQQKKHHSERYRLLKLLRCYEMTPGQFNGMMPLDLVPGLATSSDGIAVNEVIDVDDSSDDDDNASIIDVDCLDSSPAKKYSAVDVQKKRENNEEETCMTF